MIKNILVPVDGSEGADRAIENAVMLAETCGAKLNFLYVANINQLAINAVLSDAILDSVTKAGNVTVRLRWCRQASRRSRSRIRARRQWSSSTLQSRTASISLLWAAVASVL